MVYRNPTDRHLHKLNGLVMSIGSQEEAGQSRGGAEVSRPARPRGDEELSAGRG